MPGAKIPQDWDGESWECWAIEWPNSRDWLAILNGFITTPKKGRYWDETTGDLLAVQEIGVEIWDRNVPMEGCLMACNETSTGILEAMLAALQTIANNQCCQQGSGGGGTNPAPDSPVTSDETAREGDPPTGHASWEEYDQYKCDAANLIFDNLLTDIAQASIISVGGLAIGQLAVILVPLLVTPAAWVTILAIAALMIEMALVAASYAAITTHLEGNRDEYICAMLTGTDVGSSINAFTAKVDEILPDDTGFEDPVTSYVATNFLNSFATVDSFNRLYSKVAGVPTGSDCSACVDCSAQEMVISDDPKFIHTTIVENGSPFDITISSSAPWDGDGTYYTGVRLGAEECSFRLIEIISVTCTGFGQFEDCSHTLQGPSTWEELEGVVMFGVSCGNAASVSTIRFTWEYADCP